jgi:hypothetical protein
MITSKGLEKLGFDKDNDFELRDDRDGQGVQLIWKSAQPQPTEAAIEAAHAEWQAYHDSQEYARNRQAEYPSIDQLTVALWEGVVEERMASVTKLEGLRQAVMTRTTIRSEDITAGQVKAADLASDAVDTTGIQSDIAILGFKVAANGSLSKYDLIDQTIDDFQDAAGIDASGSTNEVRNASDYYSGIVVVPAATTAFTTVESTTWTAPAGVTSVNYLAVAGGGAGGGGAGRDYGGGGAGAGGLLTGTHTVVPTSSYTVTVGAGGVGVNTNARGANGGNSVFDSLTSIGGGGGGFKNASYSPGSGGSGGGLAAGGGTQGTGTAGQGSNGGTGLSSYNGAGGGGKGGGGGGASSTTGGHGGAGYDATVVFGTTYGVSGFFAGGGGAGYNNYSSGTTPGSGGTGGGGRGGPNYDSDGQPGTANTGGGGGGGSSGGGVSFTWTRYGGNGGSGVVIIKYDAVNLYNDMTLVSNATTAEAVPTKGDLVMTYTNGAGTATVNTDIKGWASRDNGSNYTQFTLTDEGDTGGHTILTAHDLDISGQPSGSAMRYKVTTHNQSAAKETRIQAVSLGWS